MEFQKEYNMGNRYQILADLKGIRIVWRFLFVDWTVKRFYTIDSAIVYLNKHYNKKLLGNVDKLENKKEYEPMNTGSKYYKS